MQNHNSKLKSDLKVRCYHFSLDLINAIKELPVNTATKIISHQVLRSGTSVGANLVEATASSSKLEFKKFHEIALKSANETKYWIGLLRDSNNMERQRANDLLSEITEVSNMLASGIMKMKGKK